MCISSFGQSGIFLIGGKTKQVKPVPILLQSGDVVIMSGESRLAYHGVPRILTSPDKHVPRTLSSETLQKSSTCPYCRSRGNEGFVVDAKKDSALCQGEVSAKRTCSCCVKDLDSWDEFESYLSVSRINVNVRQVNPT